MAAAEIQVYGKRYHIIPHMLVFMLFSTTTNVFYTFTNLNFSCSFATAFIRVIYCTTRVFEILSEHHFPSSKSFYLIT